MQGPRFLSESTTRNLISFLRQCMSVLQIYLWLIIATLTAISCCWKIIFYIIAKYLNFSLLNNIRSQKLYSHTCRLNRFKNKSKAFGIKYMANLSSYHKISVPIRYLNLDLANAFREITNTISNSYFWTSTLLETDFNIHWGI